MQIDVNLKENSYKVIIEKLPKLNFDRKVAIITNQHVAGLWLGKLLSNLNAKSISVITIKDGEEYKNMDTIEYILDSLFNEKLDRKSLIIAFGGGVVSDMAGFCASIYERGIDFINIPTTLLAQVDASVGGKTGVNNSFGKNLIGAFHQPRAVYCDSEFLSSLPERELRAGIAEAVKMAVMFDREFFEFFEKSSLQSNDDFDYVVKKCVEIKAKIVSQDEKESGVRAVLNYGHTFAHVIENETHYKRYLHGEAVSIGINMANFLAKDLGLISAQDVERVRAVLAKFKLPTRYLIKDIDAFYEAFFLDKKTQEKRVKFILPQSIGNYTLRDDIEREFVMNMLNNFGAKA